MIDIGLLKAMAAAGATVDVIIAAVEKMNAPAARKRKADAERLRRKRGQAELFESDDDQVAPQLEAVNACMALEPEPAAPVAGVARHDATDRDTSRHDATSRDFAKERKVSIPSKERNITTNTDDDDCTREDVEKSPLISPEALDLATDLGRQAGFEPAATPPGWCGAGMAIQRWLNEGCPPEVIRIAVAATIRRKRDGPPEFFGYFNKPIAQAWSWHRTPLPKVKPGTLEIIDGGRNGGRSGQRFVNGRAVGRRYGSASDALEDLVEKFAGEAERRGEKPYIPDVLDRAEGSTRDRGL